MGAFNIRSYQEKDCRQVISIWNKSARGRWVYYPLNKRKLRWLFLERQDFSPENFLLAEDDTGLAAGLIFSHEPSSEVAFLHGLFTREGLFYHSAADILLEEVLKRLAGRGAGRLATSSLSHPAASDTELLEFFWSHRFVIPAVSDPLIERQIASVGTWLSRRLDDFSLPEEVLTLQKKLETEGFSFPCFSASKDRLKNYSFEPFPFSTVFQRVVKVNSPLEHFFPVILQQRIVGGVMVSEPGAPTDWRAYGCNGGLFGPAGVKRELRGSGVGTVLLYRSIWHLKTLGYREAMIPTNASTAAFYQRAGFRLFRVAVQMERPVAPVQVKFKQVP
ncbi:MAG TPA: GNAT family N-acetyltransferase [bacterium]|nr:GNAT family N-acetyltransferase [bacterium]